MPTRSKPSPSLAQATALPKLQVRRGLDNVKLAFARDRVGDQGHYGFHIVGGCDMLCDTLWSSCLLFAHNVLDIHEGCVDEAGFWGYFISENNELNVVRSAKTQTLVEDGSEYH